MKQRFLPGCTIGVIGGGQLGRMFALEARRMGYGVGILSPDPTDPAAQVADFHLAAPYEDVDSVKRLAEKVDVMTLEFENIPSGSLEAAAEIVSVHPDNSVLSTCQHRIREKSFLRDHGFPTTEFAWMRSKLEMNQALKRIGLPAVVKTAAWGYDGRGQQMISRWEEASRLHLPSSGGGLIVERFVDFRLELSVVVARARTGETTCHGAIRNEHRNHILDLSVCPSGLSPEIEEQARRISVAVAEEIGLIGVLCVEFFLTSDDKLLINELAPRPHNSGHLTIEAHHTSQFGQQVRAVCGLPLGSTEPKTSAAMANLLGELFLNESPDWHRALSVPGVHLHLYGKSEPRTGRKMGHLTALGASADEARERVLQARRRLHFDPASWLKPSSRSQPSSLESV